MPRKKTNVVVVGGIEIGQAVRLKSGVSPVMTVEAVYLGRKPNPEAKCVWFDPRGFLQRAIFSLGALK
jgi:uncharacterized protein YodC (DUF2158 family)